MYCRSEFFPEDDAEKGFCQHLAIESPRAVPQVVEVVFEASQHFLHRVGVAVVECCIRGYARTYLIEVDIPFVVFEYLVDVEFALRSRADECHVAGKDVPELRQLVQMMRPQEAPDTGQTRVFIAAAVAQLRAHGFGVEAHRSEFVYVEGFAKASDAFLPEDCRSAVFAAHGDIAHEEQRAEGKHQQEGRDAVDYPFAVTGKRRHIVPNEAVFRYECADGRFDMERVRFGGFGAQLCRPADIVVVVERERTGQGEAAARLFVEHQIRCAHAFDRLFAHYRAGQPVFFGVSSQIVVAAALDIQPQGVCRLPVCRPCRCLRQMVQIYLVALVRLFGCGNQGIDNHWDKIYLSKRKNSQ